METFLGNDAFVDAYLGCWCKALNETEMANFWSNKNGTWTKAHMVNILYPLAKKLGYCSGCCCDVLENCEENLFHKKGCVKYGTSIAQEYYKVDFTLYQYNKQYSWALDYAIEHENEKCSLKFNNETINGTEAGWFREFLKLLPLNCAKARVIIGYDNFDDNFCVKQDKIDMCLFKLNNDDCVKSSVVIKPIVLILFPSTSAIDKICKAENKNQMELVKIVEFDYNVEKKLWEANDRYDYTKFRETIIAAYKKINKGNLE